MDLEKSKALKEVLKLLITTKEGNPRGIISYEKYLPQRQKNVNINFHTIPNGSSSHFVEITVAA